MDKVAVIGAGTMGSGIAQVCASGGLAVDLYDVDSNQLPRALRAIGRSLDRLVKKEKITREDSVAVLDRVAAKDDLEDALAGVQIVIEAAVEDPGIKQAILIDLDRRAPESAILASNTSSISITSLAAVTSRPDKVVGMHFFNPVPMMALVEVVRGLTTSEETFQSVFRLAERLGKHPVAVNDSPGFVANRILIPMINEAAFCVLEGVASPEDVDAVMKLGMAHPMGPLALADLIGLDVCLSILEVLHRELGDDKYRPCPLLRKMVAAGHLGRKTMQGFYHY